MLRSVILSFLSTLALSCMRLVDQEMFARMLPADQEMFARMLPVDQEMPAPRRPPANQVKLYLRKPAAQATPFHTYHHGNQEQGLPALVFHQVVS
jgi:hypothetical protein